MSVRVALRCGLGHGHGPRVCLARTRAPWGGMAVLVISETCWLGGVVVMRAGGRVFIIQG